MAILHATKTFKIHFIRGSNIIGDYDLSSIDDLTNKWLIEKGDTIKVINIETCLGESFSKYTILAEDIEPDLSSALVRTIHYTYESEIDT